MGGVLSVRDFDMGVISTSSSSRIVFVKSLALFRDSSRRDFMLLNLSLLQDCLASSGLP